MNKYLTIGSMCDLKGDENNTKYLIIGYKKNDKDYEAVLFPKGTTDNDGFKYFDADEVDEIYDLGYKDSVSIEYLNGLFSSNQESVELFDESDVVVKNNLNLGNIKFDENGIVVSTGFTQTAPTTSTLGDIKFDENGIVISSGTTQTTPTTPTLGDIKFDENGVVISSGITQTAPAPSTLGDIKFDENGVVISSGTTQTTPTTPTLGDIKFDENGVVISSGITQTTPTTPTLGNIKFDENGVVTSVD